MPTGFTGMGCGCCGCNVPFTVLLCGTPLSGATVTIKSGGTTITSGTTAANGTLGLTIPSAATYTVQVSKTGITTISQDLALTCGGAVVMELGPTVDPLPLTDANGTISLPLISSFPKVWGGGYFTTIAGTKTVTKGPGFCLASGTLADGRIGVCYEVDCNSDGTLTVTRFWLAVAAGVYSRWPLTETDPCHPTTAMGCAQHTSLKTSVPSSFSPFAWSDTLTAAPGNTTTDPVGGTVVLG